MDDKKGFKILVVDDDPIARDVVFSVLSREGYKVFSAPDGFEAIDFLRREKVDLLITDLVMPGIDGIELIKSALKIDSDLATVIITAYGTLDSALKAIELGAYDYITKPFKIEEILFLVARCRKYKSLVKEYKILKGFIEELFRQNAIDMDRVSDAMFKVIEMFGFLTEGEVKLYRKKLESAYGKAESFGS